jgi:hypothetical protein
MCLFVCAFRRSTPVFLVDDLPRLQHHSAHIRLRPARSVPAMDCQNGSLSHQTVLLEALENGRQEKGQKGTLAVCGHEGAGYLYDENRDEKGPLSCSATTNRGKHPRNDRHFSHDASAEVHHAWDRLCD